MINILISVYIKIMQMFGDCLSKSLINDNTEISYKSLKNVEDVFDEMNSFYSILEEEDNNSFLVPCNTPASIYDDSESDVENDTNIAYQTIINSKPITSEDQLFKKPPKSSKDAYYVWKQSKLPRYATKELIESALNKWAIENATLECDSSDSNDNIIWNITWKSTTGVTYSSKMSTFIKWMICACSRAGQVS